MANVVVKQVAELVNDEYNAAVAKFGLNHSRHESFAVLKEEIEEAEEEMEAIKEIAHSLWENTKSNAGKVNCADQFGTIQHRAIKLATEAIQVAAMARKGMTFEMESE